MPRPCAVAGMNWAMPRAPAPLTAAGLKFDSCWIWRENRSGSMPAACAAWRVWSIRSPGVVGCGPDIAPDGAGDGPGVDAAGVVRLAIACWAQSWPALMSVDVGVTGAGVGAGAGGGGGGGAMVTGAGG